MLTCCLFTVHGFSVCLCKQGRCPAQPGRSHKTRGLATVCSMREPPPSSCAMTCVTPAPRAALSSVPAPPSGWTSPQLSPEVAEGYRTGLLSIQCLLQINVRLCAIRRNSAPASICPAAGGDGSGHLIRMASVMFLHCDTTLQIV